MRFVRMCSAVAVAAVCVAGSSAPAGAEEPLHQVTYSVFSELPFRAADIYYRDTEPANWSDYSHDPYVFSPKVEADIGPTKKWVLNVQLANPDEWAMVAATSGLSPTPPNVHCVLAVDGVVVAENSGPKGALCSLRHW
ncbi:hypothetical protein BST42_26730 [Mycolicibacterium rhodesiae]|uniref:Secreted protein n=2 Tax=Mycolicibacterium rhodesiae TaxID=36814 RepID=A0A1X0IK90_MYCRH|nr:hypothetical protein BST42_26730 [Mycolicibacterium rhodesiae]